MKTRSLSACVATCIALSTTIAVADETRSGLVICHSAYTTIEGVQKVAGASLAYDDFRGRTNEFGIAPIIMSLPAAEWGAMLSAGVIDGVLFYDRDVVVGGDFEIGISGTVITETYGDAVGGCRLVAELDTCAHQRSETASTSCADPNAVQEEGQEGDNF